MQSRTGPEMITALWENSDWSEEQGEQGTVEETEIKINVVEPDRPQNLGGRWKLSGNTPMSCWRPGILKKRGATSTESEPVRPPSRQLKGRKVVYWRDKANAYATQMAVHHQLARRIKGCCRWTTEWPAERDSFRALSASQSSWRLVPAAALAPNREAIEECNPLHLGVGLR